MTGVQTCALPIYYIFHFILAEIRVFDDVDAKKVVIRNTKLYVNRIEGFVGTSMRKDE